MKRIITILIAVFIIGNVSFSQTLLQRADTAFAKKEYTTAIQLYKDVLKKKVKGTDEALINFKIGEANKLGNNFKEAITWYDKAIKAGYSEPKAIFNYAEVLTLSGDYSAAKNYYEQYLIIEPDDKVAQKRLESIKLAASKPKEAPIHAVTNVSELNTKYSEYGVAKVKDKIIFASSRMDKKSKVYELTGQGFSNFYETNHISGKWAAPVLTNGGINSDFNDGTFYYDEKSNTAYFMQCNGLQGKDQNCNLFTAKYNESNNTWSAAEKFEYNSDKFNIGHPAMTSDGLTLFFVSDMSGGKGGSDIWMMKKSQSTSVWTNPVNLGDQINTKGSEMFPYILGDSLFYFASDGLLGYGGLDIYVCKLNKDGSLGVPQNMMPPFNSSGDDFGILYLTKNSGLFSSNRQGGMGDDDIYSFDLLPVSISVSGTIIDRENKVNIPDATVTLKGSDGSVVTTKSEKDGKYEFKGLKQDVNFTIQSSKDRFLTSEEKKFSTAGVKYDKVYNKSTGYDLDLFMIAVTKEEINIPNIYYDYNKADLRPESKVELDKLISILKENPKIKIMINSHTDSRGTLVYNQDLSDRRAQSVVDYLIEKGISKDKLQSKGWAATKPLIKNAKTEDEHQANRRTTFNILNADELK